SAASFPGASRRSSAGLRLRGAQATLASMNDIATASTLAAEATGWEARLELSYERRGDRTVLVRRAHRGPLVVQKSLYPEGDGVCLGRRLAGERFASGRLSQNMVVRRDGARQWIERTRLSGGSRLLETPVGLDQKSVFGTFLAAAPRVPENLMATCREVACDDGDVAVTRVPGILLARYRGQSPESARSYFIALWARIRPALAGLDAVLPRI